MMHASLFLSTLALLPRALASSDLAFCATENTGNSDVGKSSPTNVPIIMR